MQLSAKLLYGITLGLALTFVASLAGAVAIRDVKPGEDIFAYVTRAKGQFDQTLYQQVVGAANSFKEGDEAIGVAADDDASRENARKLMANTKIKDLVDKPLFSDAQYELITNTTDMAQYNKVKNWTMGELKNFLLTKSEAQIKGIMYGLHSDVIGNVVKLMSNDELTKIGQTVFNPLPGSKIGAKGYISARVQPNSPTDNVDDIVWQTFDAYSYAVGDIVVGTNPSTANRRISKTSNWPCATSCRPSVSTSTTPGAFCRTSTCRPRLKRTTPALRPSGSRAWPAWSTPTRPST